MPGPVGWRCIALVGRLLRFPPLSAGLMGGKLHRFPAQHILEPMDADTLIASAEALVPSLAEGAHEAEILRQIPNGPT